MRRLQKTGRAARKNRRSNQLARTTRVQGALCDRLAAELKVSPLEDPAFYADLHNHWLDRGLTARAKLAKNLCFSRIRWIQACNELCRMYPG